jgi:hypothetical protein
MWQPRQCKQPITAEINLKVTAQSPVPLQWKINVLSSAVAAEMHKFRLNCSGTIARFPKLPRLPL